MKAVKWFAAVGVMLGLVLMTWGTVAQDSAAEGCSADSLTALVAEIQTANGEALTAIESGDLTSAVDALAASDERVGLMKAVCAGLVFEGTEGEVIGPIEIPEGIYRATVTTAGFIAAVLTPLEGECGQGSGSFLSAAIANESKGDAVNGAESVVTSMGCTVLIEVSNVQEPWTLMFEKIA
jgi:hypothetical protein